MIAPQHKRALFSFLNTPFFFLFTHVSFIFSFLIKNTTQMNHRNEIIYCILYDKHYHSWYIYVYSSCMMYLIYIIIISLLSCPTWILHIDNVIGSWLISRFSPISFQSNRMGLIYFPLYFLRPIKSHSIFFPYSNPSFFHKLLVKLSTLLYSLIF